MTCSRSASLNRILAHDLREPIRKIRLFAELIREDSAASLSNESSLGLEKILQESNRSLLLISEIQRFLESATSGEPLEFVNVTGVIESAAQELRQTFADWDLAVGALPKIYARARQLQILFTELLGNAFKFRSPERRLKVDIRGHTIQQNSFQKTKERYSYRDFPQIEIADNGRGFDSQYRNYVFELFKKIDLTGDGLGLGLPICRQIAMGHFGSLDVDSVPDEGTTFTLRLPVSP